MEKPDLPQKQQTATSNAAIKGKIEKDFAALSIEKEEEPDLLDLMDN